uniref:Uncharacterized protein n=1 Tax=Pygocentrus nattereri TaxID=42514 RepID=A0A3B4DUN9_PYGNA
MSTELNHSQDVECSLMASSGGQHRDYRKLAIGSIICGLSCLGIIFLVHYIKERLSNTRVAKMKLLLYQISPFHLKWCRIYIRRLSQNLRWN